MLDALDEIGDLLRAQPYLGLSLAILSIVIAAAVWSAVERRCRK